MPHAAEGAAALQIFNPLDPNDGQSKCLQIQQDQPAIVIDFGGYLTPAARACFVQAKIPMAGATARIGAIRSLAFSALPLTSNWTSAEWRSRDTSPARGWSIGETMLVTSSVKMPKR